ncbi:MAG TPA: septum formation initiator [Stellaceae bacterium]|nr:septum formation initiator [Stellaceae bacterium]
MVIVALLTSATWADDKPTAAVPELPARVETRHTINLAGPSAAHPLDYRAVAETIGLTDRKGAQVASVYTVSYLVDPPAGQQRPVAFVFNGGPGAASVFLHLGAIGPRILETPATGAVPEPPVHLIDNQSTWLRFTDLVFVDPVGTGFSHGSGKEDNPDKPFWNVHGDLESLGAVVRRWLTRHERWSATVFLVGESYGGLRAAALAQSLEHDVGVSVSGLVLISPALDVELLHPDITNALAGAFELPSYASAAAVFSGSEAVAETARAAERFGLSDYLVGIAGLKGLPEPGDPFIARIARLIGLPDEVVRRARGRVPIQEFVRELRRPHGEVLSRYDATVARAAGTNPQDDNAGDPVLDPAVPAYTSAFDTYAPEALGYRTERPYRVLPREVSRQWDWDGARGGAGGLGLALSSLERTLLQHPGTRVLIANGRYDLVTPYLASRWLVDQLGLPEAVRTRIAVRVYEGGHMMYMRPKSRAALAADAAEIFAPQAAAPPH